MGVVFALGACERSKVTPNPDFSGVISAPSSKVRLPVSISGKTGYIDGQGKVVINPQFEYAETFAEGLAPVCFGNCEFEHRLSFAGSGVKNTAHQDFSFGFIDESGNVAINPRFQDVRGFSEGFAAVCEGDNCLKTMIPSSDRKWGYIDRKGQEVIPPQFDSADSFKEGLASVSIGNKFGYVDKTGKFAINPQYDAAWDFEQGVARVGIGSKLGYIDKAGRYIWEPSE